MTITLDGSGASGFGNGSATNTLTFSTSNTNDIIVVAVTLDRTDSTAPVCNSVTATGLTFTKRATKTASNGALRYETTYWTAVAAATQSSKVVTCTFASGTNCLSSSALAAFSGCDTSTIFDSNVSLPATASGTGTSNPTVNVSTTNANDVILGITSGYTTHTVGSGYTLAKHGGDPGAGAFVSIEYQVVSATQTNLAVNWTDAAADWQLIGDAIMQASTPTTTTIAMTLPALTLALNASAERSDIAMTLPVLTMTLAVGGNSLLDAPIAMTLPLLILNADGQVGTPGTQPNDMEPNIADAGEAYWWAWGL